MHAPLCWFYVSHILSYHTSGSRGGGKILDPPVHHIICSLLMSVHQKWALQDFIMFLPYFMVKTAHVNNNAQVCATHLLSAYRLNTHECCKSKWSWGLPSTMSLPTDLIDSYMYSHMHVNVH